MKKEKGLDNGILVTNWDGEKNNFQRDLQRIWCETTLDMSEYF